MKTSAKPDHHALASALGQKALGGPGKTPPEVRRAAAQRAAGRGPATPTLTPYDDLARQIGESARLVTDAQVAKVLAATGAEKATFEVIMAAAVGAGLLRWQEGIRALEEAIRAPA